MNRTERLRALVNELHAVAPAPRTTRWLADRFAVSQRTIERDTSALAAAGAPVFLVSGRHRGYAVDPSRGLPPVSLTTDEAVAVAVGLDRLRGTALAAPADTVLAKLRARYPALPEAAAVAVTATEPVADRFPPVPAVIQEALRAERVLHLDYADRHGRISDRTVEPIGVIGTPEHWLLLAYCRMRHGLRTFRVDRIHTARIGTEPVTAHRSFSWVAAPD